MNKKWIIFSLSAMLIMVASTTEAGTVVKGKFFRADLTDPGLSEFNVSINSDADIYLFATVWQEVNKSAERPKRVLFPLLIGHYGEGSFSKMVKKMEWELSNSPFISKEDIERKKTGYRLYLQKKYNLTGGEN